MSTTDVEALQLRFEASATKLEKDMAKVRLIVDNSLRTIEGRAERASRGFDVIGSRAGSVGSQVTAGMTKASRSLNTLQGQTGNIAAQFTSPKISWSGIGTRTVQITVENIFSAQNYAPGGRWNPADQKRRFPGDLGLDFVGVDIVEYWS